jgi:hypothetical protein
MNIVALLLAAGLMATADSAPYEVVVVGTGRIAVPKGWRNLDQAANKVLYRQGDGIGVPAADETGDPLQIGMVVETFGTAKESIEEIMDSVIAGAKGDPRLELVKKDVTKVKLADGTDALLLRAEFIKAHIRRSYQTKLVTKNAGANVWIVSAHLVGGKDSEWPRAGSRLAKWLEAHLTSFTFDGSKFDAKKVDAVYE